MPKPSKAGSVTDTEREEGEQKAKTEETQTDTGKHTMFFLLLADRTIIYDYFAHNNSILNV